MDVNDGVMKQLGLTMNVRIPVTDAKAGDKLGIRHYLMPKNSITGEGKQAVVKETGSSQYAEITVDHCSLFELPAAAAATSAPGESSPKNKVESPETGDPGVTVWIWLLMLGMSGTLLTVYRKKKG